MNIQELVNAIHKGIITAEVPEDYQFDLVDLGICKFHFECGMKSGKFQWGNGSAFVREQQ